MEQEIIRLFPVHRRKSILSLMLIASSTFSTPGILFVVLSSAMEAVLTNLLLFFEQLLG